jgi:hypothetical protein
VPKYYYYCASLAWCGNNSPAAGLPPLSQLVFFCIKHNLSSNNTIKFYLVNQLSVRALISMFVNFFGITNWGGAYLRGTAADRQTDRLIDQAPALLCGPGKNPVTSVGALSAGLVKTL